MELPSLDLLSRISFALAILTSVYFIRRTNSDPNPAPNGIERGNRKDNGSIAKSDFLMTAGNELTMRRHLNFLTAVGIYHAFVAGLPDHQRTALCPAYTDTPSPSPSPTRAANTSPSVNPALFTWTPYTATTIAVLIAAALLRVAAYTNLGTSFTFRITKPPAGLKTTGVHRYVRHPSYTAFLIVAACVVMLLFREQGLVGCWFGSGIARVVERAALGWGFVVTPGLFWARVMQEEEFLAGVFGEQWGVYCARTKRFIPGVF
ncbi:methyltransferase family protein [Aspergillus puulaauensis]|uniref:Protein-S-isoprenylcysteine O-methyltransferase n=1 Tax=Aspergillus puulaauensis TaxID=1220207 RepID=A0A7R7XP53_9EURO|nr:uncharacterized protein APUU_41591S [Aspergillus puulaauensis]BCS25147.1 hypothetical protein APUU_41591S [Aspergillus puulaauensis]